MRRGARRRALLAIGSGLILAGAGCANFVDKVTSHDFRVKNLFVEPDPIAVLRDSTDGDARARALRKVKEPVKNHGSAELQDEVVNYLTQAATSDQRPLCRLAAIETLGRFDDPRCAAALVQAYQNAEAFPTETANPIRCEALAALGHKDNPEVLALLTQVATTTKSPAAKTGNRLASYEGEEELAKLLGQYDPETQSARDGRLAAVRALGLTRNRQAIDVLLPMLSDRDVALRDRAHEALQSITGRHDVAKNADAWRSALGVASSSTTN